VDITVASLLLASPCTWVGGLIIGGLRGWLVMAYIRMEKE
jgi:hypothetical protein